MIIDIGGGTTEIAVISRRIVTSKSIKTGGDEFNERLSNVFVNHGINVGEAMAEK